MLALPARLALRPYAVLTPRRCRRHCRHDYGWRAIDPDLLEFIQGSVRSVWALEVLLLMRRGGGRPWSAEGLARELRANDRLVGEVLGEFETSGLVSRTDEGFIYGPASPVLDALCARLESAYRERPVAVVRAIMSSPKDKLQIFADAFRFKPTE